MKKLVSARGIERLRKDSNTHLGSRFVQMLLAREVMSNPNPNSAKEFRDLTFRNEFERTYIAKAQPGCLVLAKAWFH
jgi:hypothetical protein